VETKNIEVEEKTKQPVEIEQPTNSSSTPVEGGFFDIKVNSPNILITIPIKARSKYMMRRKGKE